MTTLKQGDLIKNVEGKTCKVFGICGDVRHVSFSDDHNTYATTQTENELRKNGYTWDTPAWEIKEDETYWFISDHNKPKNCIWEDDKFDKSRRDFLGIYQTKELAEAALLEIRRKLGK